MRSRARYSRRVASPKPPAIDERGWEIFTAYCRKERTFDEIGRDFHLSPNQVRRIVDEVHAQLGRVPGTAPKLIAFESPLEDVGLSVRTLNALHGVGCHTVDDALRLNLSSAVRGLGRKTKSELLSMLERAGFQHPSLEEQPITEIRVLERSLERMQSRLERALTAVAKEIRFVRERLHKKMSRSGKKAGAGIKAPQREAPGREAPQRDGPAPSPIDEYRGEGK